MTTMLSDDKVISYILEVMVPMLVPVDRQGSNEFPETILFRSEVIPHPIYGCIYIYIVFNCRVYI
jgi:hypothetical protein